MDSRTPEAAVRTLTMTYATKTDRTIPSEAPPMPRITLFFTDNKESGSLRTAAQCLPLIMASAFALGAIE